MKYLCLAYGAERDWNALPRAEQDALLARDEVLRWRGDLVAAVQDRPMTLRAWSGDPEVTASPFASSDVPLAGFGIIEAGSLAEVVQLLEGTPCARARGAIEIRAIAAMNEWRSGGVE